MPDSLHRLEALFSKCRKSITASVKGYWRRWTVAVADVYGAIQGVGIKELPMNRKKDAVNTVCLNTRLPRRRYSLY